GLISAPMRTWRGGELDQFMRPDLTMYSGFSGGPLVNSEGEIVGLNTGGLHRSGLTVPASTVTRVAAELLEKGRVERPYRPGDARCSGAGIPARPAESKCHRGPAARAR